MGQPANRFFMYLKSIMVSCFNNICETDNPTYRPILEVLADMGYAKKPTDTQLKDKVSLVRKAATPEEQDSLKVKLLPVICPSGVFGRRADAALLDYNGIICLDLDNTLDIKGMKAMAMSYPYTLAAMTSPTGTGVKVFVLTDLKDPLRHSDAYHYLGDLMGFKKRFDLKFDPSCSNPSRACFMSYDHNIVVNENAVPLHIDLTTLPAYVPPAKTPVSAVTPKLRTDIATDDVDFPSPLSDYGKIRTAIKETHMLFEEYYPMVQGVRNSNLYILAFFFRLDGIPEDTATDYLVAYYSDPAGGFSASEIKRTVKSVYSR